MTPDPMLETGSTPPSGGPASPLPEPRPPRSVTPALVIGISIVFFGAVLMLDNLGLVDSHFVFRFWPLVLVVLGLLKIRSCQGPCTGGYLLTGAGAFLLLMTLGRRHIDDILGPLMLITVGIFIVLHGLKRHRQVPPDLQRSEGFIRGHAILSGFDHRLQTQSFRGGELTAIFGGFNLDLRQAAMDTPSTRLDAFVMFGGGDLRVPEGWDVVIQATAIFAGVSDRTVPVPRTDSTRPRLIITGLVLFGGIEIKH